jgi:menaquinol-cytochrome c reductase iron-sulfur subunit
MTPEPDRRSFLGFAIFGLGAIFSAILGIPVACYFLDPRNRKGPASSFRVADGIKLDELAKDAPRQGVIRDTRLDGWTLYPNDVLGRVWVVQAGDRPDLGDPDKVQAFNATPLIDREKYLFVFTVKCPHLGCSVNLNGVGNGFECPCHNATFKLDGEQTGGPAQRGMDTLDWQIDPGDPSRLRVEFRTFQASSAEKKPLG